MIGDACALGPAVRGLGEERGVEAAIVHDGMQVALR